MPEITLLSIGQLLAEKKGRQHDHPYIMQCMDLVVIYRARIMAESISRNPNFAKYYLQTIFLNLEDVPLNECADLEDEECENIKRTIDEVPSSLRVWSTPYYFVGNETGEDSFSYTSVGYEKYYKYARFGIGKKERYEVKDSKIFVHNNKDIKLLKVVDVFDDPREAAKFKCGDGTSCYNPATDKFPIDNKTLQIVMEMITEKEILRSQPEADQIEVKADHNE